MAEMTADVTDELYALQLRLQDLWAYLLTNPAGLPFEVLRLQYQYMEKALFHTLLGGSVFYGFRKEPEFLELETYCKLRLELHEESMERELVFAGWSEDGSCERVEWRQSVYGDLKVESDLEVLGFFDRKGVRVGELEYCRVKADVEDREGKRYNVLLVPMKGPRVVRFHWERFTRELLD